MKREPWADTYALVPATRRAAAGGLTVSVHSRFVLHACSVLQTTTLNWSESIYVRRHQTTGPDRDSWDRDTDRMGNSLLPAGTDRTYIRVSVANVQWPGAGHTIAICNILYFNCMIWSTSVSDHCTRAAAETIDQQRACPSADKIDRACPPRHAPIYIIRRRQSPTPCICVAPRRASLLLPYRTPRVKLVSWVFFVSFGRYRNKNVYL